MDDLVTRFEVAGLPEEKRVTNQDLNQVADWIKQTPTEKVYVLATYSATMELRHVFTQQGYLKEG